MRNIRVLKKGDQLFLSISTVTLFLFAILRFYARIWLIFN